MGNHTQAAGTPKLTKFVFALLNCKTFCTSYVLFRICYSDYVRLALRYHLQSDSFLLMLITVVYSDICTTFSSFFFSFILLTDGTGGDEALQAIDFVLIAIVCVALIVGLYCVLRRVCRAVSAYLL